MAEGNPTGRGVLYRGGGAKGWTCDSEFLQNSPMDTAAETNKLVLVVCCHPVPGRFYEAEAVRRWLQGLNNRLVVVIVIRGNPQPALRLEDAQGLLEELRLKQSSLVMPGLWPRIREIHMQCPDGFTGDKKLDELTSITVDEPEIQQTSTARPIMGQSKILGCDFNPHKVALGPALRRIEQEASLAKAKLDLNGGIIAEQAPQIQRGIVV